MFNISLDEGYQAMAADTAREAEGMEWYHAIIKDMVNA